MSKKIFIIAGEASGDMLGAALMKDIKALDPHVVFTGIGGPDMTEQGLTSLFPMSDLSVMGLAEVLSHLPRILKRMRQTVAAIKREKPDILLTVDAPDFCLRVAKKIKQSTPRIQAVHVVAPTVWAWREGRAAKIAKFLDGLLCLFPFEPPYFTRHGLKAEFIGHPLTRMIGSSSDATKRGFCIQHGLDPDKPVLCLLPGSRSGEIDKLLPIFIRVAAQLKKHISDLQIILPTLPSKHAKILSQISGKGSIHVFVPKNAQEKYTAFAASDVALHASGTVALELALCGTPMVTAYKVNALSAWIGKRLIKTPHVNLVNILFGHPVVPELLQEKATVDDLVSVTQALLTNESLRNLQKEQLGTIRTLLNENAPQAAARFVHSLLKTS